MLSPALESAEVMWAPRSSSALVMLFGDLVDAGGDRVRDQRDVVAQVDLHAGNGAAHLLGLADQVVALVGDVLQQRADAHFVVGIGAFQRGHFVGDQRFQFAGARDRALDAVAHRRDLAADGLADRHHGIGCGALRLGEADRDLRHRLRDHAQFLAAPGEAREEIEQQHRCEEQRRQAGEHEHAARPWPIAACSEGRKATVRSAQPMSQTTANSVASV